MENCEWEQTSISWKALMPLPDLNRFPESAESPQQHYRRLFQRFSIPLEVVEQWLHPHYYNADSVKNYGWMDYDQMRFEETFMSTRHLMELNIVKKYRTYVKTRKLNQPFDGFACVPKDIEHWREMGTWRVPPIVIDVQNLSAIPAHAELKGPFQLVEGHSRLGYLLAMHRTGRVTSDSSHRVYRMYMPKKDDVL